LTEDEIKSILDNKDIWMEGEEVLKRLKNKHKVLEEKKMRKPNVKKPAPRKPKSQ